MRYFLFLVCPEPALSIRVAVLAAAGRTVAFGGSPQRVGSRLFGAAMRAIDVTAVAVTTDDDLAMTAGAVVQPRTGTHQLALPTSAGLTGHWM